MLELDQSDVDVETLDMLAELAQALAAGSVELRLAAVGVPVAELLERSGVAARVRIVPTIDAATGIPRP